MIKHSKNVPPFLQYCSSTIPAMFDDSMSYYEALCALWKWLQSNLVDVVNNNAEVTEQYIKVVEELDKYVRDYFKNLDVQEEINNKLDEMVESGELQEIIGDYALKKVDYYLVDNTMSQTEIQDLMNVEREKIIEFKNQTYTFESPFRINSNTKILLNNAVINSGRHIFYNFKDTDTSITGYNGSHNISIIGGTLNGCISFIHGKNILVKDVKFYHVENDHCFEICACKDYTVDNCYFEGVKTQTVDRQYVECIQIENATRTNFPWLEESETYDETACEYVTVKDCIFKQTDIITYQTYAGVGGHTYVESKPHSNITISGCHFTDTIANCIRLHNMNNAVIKNNIFIETNITNPNGEDVQAIRLLNGGNAIIENNTFSGFSSSQMYFATGTTAYIRNNILSDMAKQSISESDLNNNNILFRGATLYIENNKFINNKSGYFYQLGSSESDRSKLVSIINNQFINESSYTDCAYWPSRIYNTEKIVMTDNTFNIYHANAGALLRTHQNVAHVIFKSNTRTDEQGKLFDANGYVGSYKDIYDTYIMAYAGNVTDLTNQTLNVKYTDFTEAVLIMGDGGNTNNVTIRPFDVTKRLDSRTCVAPIASKSAETIGYVYITFNNDDDKTINLHSSLSGIKLRYIMLINR